ncbi:hypothetical protein BU15DRAFT_75186 [Melanogaster broomeanus]|nr:hypothetical protein BU15DRAFT_75186 [Melanogaster broomeanus]
MKTAFASLALFVAGALAQFTINTPANVVECQPTLLSWSGGVSPYYLRQVILPGASPNGAALEDLGEMNTTSVTWTCNIAAGTSLGLTLRDSSGTVAQSAPFTVNPGSSITCLNTTSLVPGPTVAPGTTAGSTPTSAGGTTASGATSKASSAGTSSTASATPTGAALSNTASLGAAGIVGAAVAALFL